MATPAEELRLDMDSMYRHCSDRTAEVNDSAAAASEPAPGGTQPPASRNLFEPFRGAPVVRAQVTYSELLRDMRLGKVAAMHWYGRRDRVEHMTYPTGDCVVEYTTGRLAQAQVPPDDVRCAAACCWAYRLLRGLPPAASGHRLRPRTACLHTLSNAMKLMPFSTFAVGM